MDKNIAVIGAGDWGKNLIRVFSELGALHTVCDINPEFGVERNYINVITNKDIQGVVIATENKYHYPIARESLCIGKDVFVEKPMTLDLKQAEELVELAEYNRRILMVGHIMLYHPAIVKLKELISPIQYIHSTRITHCKSSDVLWTLGSHDISVMLYLLGEAPTKISSYVIPNAAVISLEFNKSKGHILLGNSDIRKDRTIVAQDGVMEARFDEDGLAVLENGHIRSIPFPSGEPLLLECQDFVNCIRTRQQPKANGREALEVIKILSTCEEQL